ncbi:MAG TPA: DUF5688 family protein [Mobilitalea sp.]|nr:DUF5688 family protein [Mobilitalea sp.]
MSEILQERTMNYDSFVSAMKQIIEVRMGDGYDISIYKVIKNNSLELDSLVVLQEGRNIAPNIYLMPYYESYLEGTAIDEVADRLCGVYQNGSVQNVDDDFSYTLKEMKPYIFYRLVSFDKNIKLLENVPHIKYLDLAITFHCLVRSDEDGIGTIRITNEHMKLWDVSLGDLKELAVANTERLFPANIKSMEEVLMGMLSSDLVLADGDNPMADLSPKLIDDLKNPCQHEMYILTNQKGINGASCMLYGDIIRTFANHINSDLYILPSSIHEILLVPQTPDMKIESLTKMVEEVNQTQVAREEVLSDNVYYFSRELNSIIL